MSSNPQSQFMQILEHLKPNVFKADHSVEFANEVIRSLIAAILING